MPASRFARRLTASPIPPSSRWRDCRQPVGRSDECQQAGLLAPRSFFRSAFKSPKNGPFGCHFWREQSSLDTAAPPPGIFTRFPIILQPKLKALADKDTLLIVCRVKITYYE